MKTEIGVFGLGVMGKSLSRNLARNGFSVSLYNRHVDEKEDELDMAKADAVAVHVGWRVARVEVRTHCRRLPALVPHEPGVDDHE